MHEKEKRPAAEVVLTVLHAGGKFGDGGGYKVSGGLHGVGVSVVNALSERLDLEVRRDGHVWTQELRARRSARASWRRAQRPPRPAPRSPSCPISRSSTRSSSTSRRSRSGCARPPSSPRASRSSSSTSAARGDRVEFHYEGGIRDFVAYLNENKEPIHRKVIYFEGESDEGQAEVSLQWNSSYQESIFSFANNINTTEGGTHLSGFSSALTRTLNDYARRKGELKEKDESLTGEDVREGLTAIVSVKLHDPQFEGQTKSKLGNPPIKGFVESSSTASSPSSSRRTRPRRVRSSRRRSRPRAHGTPPARRATSRAASPCSRTRSCRTSSRTAP